MSVMALNHANSTEFFLDHRIEEWLRPQLQEWAWSNLRVDPLPGNLAAAISKFDLASPTAGSNFLVAFLRKSISSQKLNKQPLSSPRAMERAIRDQGNAWLVSQDAADWH